MTWIVTRPYPDGRRRVHNGDRYLHELQRSTDGRSYWALGRAEGTSSPALPELMTLEEAIDCADANFPLATDRRTESVSAEPLVVNWWTDMDIRALLKHLANATGVDVYGQRDEHAMTRDELVHELRSLCTIIVEADIQPVVFVEPEAP